MTMDPAEVYMQTMQLRQIPIKKVTALGNSTIQKFYAESTIFITGGSGFLGKLLIEKLCRACDIKNIYMLIRRKKEKTVEERLTETLNDPAFESLHKEQPTFAKKIIAVEGDISKKRLGLCDNDWNTILNEVEIIFHVAANVRFDVDLKDAILSNVRGSRETLTLGKACTKLRAYVHVSTAYTFATDDRIGGLVLEEFQPSPADPDAMIEMAETMSVDALNEITPSLLGKWPNTYTFSKAISEEAVRTQSDSMPVCVVRPAIVIPTYKEPAPGWVDTSNVFGPSGLILGIGLGVIRALFSHSDVRIGFTPADLVTNAIIAAGWDTASKPATENRKIEIYTVSNIRNPILWGQTGDILRKNRYNLSTPKAIGFGHAYVINNPFMFWLITLLFHFVPGYLADGVCLLMGKKRRFVKIYKKVYKLSKVLSYFTRHDWEFSDENLHSLFKRMSKSDQTIFNFDLKTVDWDDSIRIWWVGLRKYIIKDGLKDTVYATKKQKILYLGYCIVHILYFYLFFKILTLTYLGASSIISFFTNKYF